MSYSDNEVATVRSANDIVDVVSEVVSVSRRGRLVWALCPFHQEKTPSFKVDSSTGLYYCFGCGEGGDVIRFVQKTKGLSFVEAVEYLAARAGIVLVGSRSSRQAQGGNRRRLQEAVSEACDFYHRYLVEAAEAVKARTYLEKRGIGSELIARFRLGFSPDGWDRLSRHLKEKGFAERTILDAGLATRTESGRLRDFFRARVIFPIFDATGKPIGFGGRTLPDAPPEAGPKYRNSPNTPLFEKSHTLYGFHLAKRGISEKGSVVVVEGYTDVIGLHKIGVTNAVATCGTAFGVDHVEILRRHGLTVTSGRDFATPPKGALVVVLAFDSDTAGELAGGRAFDRVLIAGAAEFLDVRIALLPRGQDPADVAESNPEALHEALETAVPALGFLIERAISGARLDSVESRVAAARAAVAQVLRHPDSIVQQQYLQQIAELCGLTPKEVRQIWSELHSRSRKPRAPGGNSQTQATPARSARYTGFERGPRAASSTSNLGMARTPNPQEQVSHASVSSIGAGQKSSHLDASLAASESSRESSRFEAPGGPGEVSASGFGEQFPRSARGYLPRSDRYPDSSRSFPSSVPAVDLDKIRLCIYGSPDAVSHLLGFDLSDVMKSDAAQRAIEALIRAKGDLATAVRKLESDAHARDALMRAASGSFEFGEDDKRRWESSVLADARRRALEKEARRAKAAGDLEAYRRIWRELKGVTSPDC